MELPNPLPEHIVKGSVADARRLLALDETQRTALFAALAAFVPSASAIEREEMEKLAASTKLDSNTIAAAGRIAYFLRGSDRPGSLNTQDIREALKRAFAAAQISEADRLLEPLAAIGTTMGTKIARARRLEQVLPSLITSTISCDLRYLKAEMGDEAEFVPVAVVRLELDEADDAIFHCSPQKLKNLIRSLQNAVDDLEFLDRVAQNMPKP